MTCQNKRYVGSMNIKTVPFFCFILAAVIAMAISAADGQSTTSAVTLYQLANGGGAGQDIPPGIYRVNGKQLATGVKEPVFSVRVSAGFRVRFCDDDGQAGKSTGFCEEFTVGTSDIKSVNFTHIRVWADTSVASVAALVVYEGANWSGRTQVFVPGMYRADRNEFGKVNNDMAMSVIIAKGYRARFCVDEGKWARGAGDCEIHDEGRHNLRFADSISFIEVLDLSDRNPPDDSMPVVLFEDKGQAGKMQGFDIGVYLGGRKQLGKILDNTASSVSVKKGFRVMVCDDEIPGDKCEEYGEGKHDLRFKDSASYLKVWKSEL